MIKVDSKSIVPTSEQIDNSLLPVPPIQLKVRQELEKRNNFLIRVQKAADLHLASQIPIKSDS